MSLVIANSPTSVQKRNRRRKKKYNPIFSASEAYCAKRPIEQPTKDVATHDDYFTMPGPEKSYWTIRAISEDQKLDYMHMSSWRRISAKFLVFAAVIPAALEPYASYIQFRSLITMAQEKSMPQWMIYVAWIMVATKILLHGESTLSTIIPRDSDQLLTI
jgi:hypothetical protein